MYLSVNSISKNKLISDEKIYFIFTYFDFYLTRDSEVAKYLTWEEDPHLGTAPKTGGFSPL